ncbi:hypothetical protein C7974DRAFT_204806 [Boeremia exigua]|uniref:uncharacterized protein n=1 Tax=Boeremia exigua TaxID=749465 RepID=UPI001E8D71CF|nr:uncharacterized protein C7974DRAFT_204806 [Boeremia exigua]KAH6625650.1 hypothetical protein C7974DRAFT_204806 [Boeremia exigua]
MRSTLSFLASLSAVSAYTVINHKPFMNKNVDALVVPGTYTSHMHTFFGSDVITNVKPTTAELQKGCYSGDNANDLSVYWVPTLYYIKDDERIEVPIYRFSSYYQNSGYAEAAFPADTGLIAGNASAHTQAAADHKYNLLEWWCEMDESEAKDAGKFPTKTCSTHLQVQLRFPDCYSSETLKYEYSEVAWGNANRCPDGMKRIPQLRFSIRYDLRKALPEGWSGTAPLQLSCSDTVGDGYCMHGDFINGWYADAAENMLKADADGKQKFKSVDGEHGTGSKPSECTPEDADPNNGTSDYETSLTMMKNGGQKSDAAPAVGAAANDAVIEESCSTKRSIGNKSKRDAARRALKKALEALDALEE